MRADEEWVRELCRAIVERGNRSYVEMFEVARAHLDDAEFERRVVEYLEGEPALLDSWETFSGDYRGSRASYLSGTTVGYFDGSSRDVVVHADRVHACADYIHRRSVEVLTRRRLPKA